MFSIHRDQIHSVSTLCVLFTALAYTQTDSTAVILENYQKYADSIEKTLNYQYGKIELQNGIATIDVAVETLKVPTLQIPSDPSSSTTLTEKKIWEEKVKLHVKKEVTIEENVKKLYSVVLCKQRSRHS